MADSAVDQTINSPGRGGRQTVLGYLAISGVVLLLMMLLGFLMRLGQGGLIAVDRSGRVAMPFNTDGMKRGVVRASNSIRSECSAREMKTLWPLIT